MSISFESCHSLDLLLSGAEKLEVTECKEHECLLLIGEFVVTLHMSLGVDWLV